MQLEGRIDRAHDVVAPVHDDGRDAADLVDAVEQLILVREEAAIHEIVGFDARERQRELRCAELVLALDVRQQRARRAFPHGPRARRRQAHGLVVGQ